MCNVSTETERHAAFKGFFRKLTNKSCQNFYALKAACQFKNIFNS